MILLKPSCAPRYRWISGLLLGVLLILAGSAPVVSQTPISARTQIDIQFPASITFSLTASSSSPITSTVLRYSLDRLSCFEEIVDRHVDFSPDRELQVSWTMNMRRIGGLPSGARIHYRWLIEDEDGNRQETPQETFLF
ncbi:MAG: hypothetical protein QGH23_02765, partial [Dehalococcoidia bacterium]|nr:hypothetical protein [Dehalococcoidia bacterium]